MSFPNSIRLDPIRLPRPTILRESPIFDIGHPINTPSFKRDVIRTHVRPNQGPFTYAEYLRTRRLDDINFNPVNDEPLYTIKARALCSNPSLGYQRIMFIFTKYPALVLAMVALWNVEGRGKEIPKSTTEKYAFYSALATAAIVLVSQILLQTNHHYSYKKAKVMSYLHHNVLVASFCAAVTCTVSSAINFNNIWKMTEASGWQYINNNSSTQQSYSNQERATHQAVLAGSSAMIILFALAAFVYGGIGLSLMKKRLADEYGKEARLSVYENQAFQY